MENHKTKCVVLIKVALRYLQNWSNSYMRTKILVEDLATFGTHVSIGENDVDFSIICL